VGGGGGGVPTFFEESRQRNFQAIIFDFSRVSPTQPMRIDGSKFKNI
jgi:hypothetical protein